MISGGIQLEVATMVSLLRFFDRSEATARQEKNRTELSDYSLARSRFAWFCIGGALVQVILVAPLRWLQCDKIFFNRSKRYELHDLDQNRFSN